MRTLFAGLLPVHTIGDVVTPGMPVEVFFPATMLSYIVKPMSDQLNRAFREE